MYATQLQCSTNKKLQKLNTLLFYINDDQVRGNPKVSRRSVVCCKYEFRDLSILIKLFTEQNKVYYNANISSRHNKNHRTQQRVSNIHDDRPSAICGHESTEALTPPLTVSTTSVIPVNSNHN